LALTFSSFETPILMDSDTVPFVSIEKFYELKEFQKTGVQFFKDRVISDDLFESSELEILREIIYGCIGLDLEDES
ncbi:alpha-1,3-mannosyltransferase family protein, partial [Erysipelatoclostridium ramosum]